MRPGFTLLAECWKELCDIVGGYARHWLPARSLVEEVRLHLGSHHLVEPEWNLPSEEIDVYLKCYPLHLCTDEACSSGRLHSGTFSALCGIFIIMSIFASEFKFRQHTFCIITTYVLHI